MKRIRIAQIGTSRNSHGNPIWKSLLKQSDIFEVVGYAFPENEREKFPSPSKAFDGYRELTVDEILNDPTIEAVAVETEEIYLTKYALAVAEAGKHLHMEKPGGTELCEFERLIGILREKNLVFSTGYMYRFNPRINEIIERVKNGEFGRIYSVEAHMSCKHPEDTRSWLSNFPGGMMFFLGCHLIDLIYRIKGEPREVIPLSSPTGIDGIATDTYGMAVFKYDDGVSFAKTCDDECGGFLRRQLVIAGEKGTVEIKPLEGYEGDKLFTVSREAFGDEWLLEWQEDKSGLFDRYDDMMKNFAELVRGKENPYSYDYELALYKLVMRACGAI